MSAAIGMATDDPKRVMILEFYRHLDTECPRERRSHTAKLAGTPLPPESEVIPMFLRKNPDEIDILEERGALKPLLA